MKPLPIFLITGFLGSGKTTFINWILHKYPTAHISVILNEFGDMKLESAFVQKHTGSVIELANGCMCCVAKSDIPRVVEYILKNSPQTEYILIEASGLSDPDPIKEVLDTPPLNAFVYLHTTLCIIDTTTFMDTYKDHPLVLSQAGDADAIIFSKLSACPPEKLETTKHIVTTNLSHTPTYDWSDAFDMEVFSLRQSVKSQTGDDHHHLHEVFEQYWFTTDEPIDMKKFEKSFETLDPMVYRAKGRVMDSSNTLHLVQYVSSNLVIEASKEVPTNPKTAILFLGEKLDTSLLGSLFESTKQH